MFNLLHTPHSRTQTSLVNKEPLSSHSLFLFTISSSPTMASLNPQAPEFFPTQFNELHKVQPPPCLNFSTSIFTPPLYYYYYSLPSSHNHFYYPTPSTTLLQPSALPFHHATLHDAEPTHFSNMKRERNTVEALASVPPKKKEVVAERKACGASKGFVEKQMFKAFLGCGKLKGRHRFDGLNNKGYTAPRMRLEVNGQRKKVDCLSNNRFTRHQHEQCFKGFSKNRSCDPLLPVRADGGDTTVMIRNIPTKYTRELLVDFLDNHCRKVNLREKEAGNEKGEESSALAFDFVYLPIDFISGMNKGYAFVNFTNPQAAWKFLLTASSMKWGLFQSHKIREVVSARLQGKKKLEKHFETMCFPCDTEGVLPLCFSPPRDGVTKGEQRAVGNLIKRKHV